MENRIYDAVIVGARCAGSALAAFLARSGADVIALEADRLGTDQVISTHAVHPPGMDLLDELGVGAAVREGSPPARVIRFQMDGAYADIAPPPGRVECCPRRYRLDRLLQQAASDAGAEVCESTRVTGLLRDGDRVVGVRAEQAGREIEVRAAITVGADGRHSTVARLAGAEEYLGYDSPRAMYWAYWEPSAAWNSQAYPYDFLIQSSGKHRRFIFTTDNNQVLLATMPLLEEGRRWREKVEAGYVDDLRSDPVFRPLVSDGKRMSKIIGTVSERFFYRRAVGPGWALVGDAGHHKDPIIGWGISEALSQAKQLAEAIQAGRESALERYWRRRDIDTLPRFRLGEERALPQPISPVFPVVIDKAHRTPGLPQQLFRETEYDVNPYELLPASKVAFWILSAALRGRPGLILAFIRQGRYIAKVQAEVRKRRKLLDKFTAN